MIKHRKFRLRSLRRPSSIWMFHGQTWSQLQQCTFLRWLIHFQVNSSDDKIHWRLEENLSVVETTVYRLLFALGSARHWLSIYVRGKGGRNVWCTLKGSSACVSKSEGCTRLWWWLFNIISQVIHKPDPCQQRIFLPSSSLWCSSLKCFFFLKLLHHNELHWKLWFEANCSPSSENSLDIILKQLNSNNVSFHFSTIFMYSQKKIMFKNTKAEFQLGPLLDVDMMNSKVLGNRMTLQR